MLMKVIWSREEQGNNFSVSLLKDGRLEFGSLDLAFFYSRSKDLWDSVDDYSYILKENKSIC